MLIVVLLGRMATCGEEVLRRHLRTPCNIRSIRDARQAEQRLELFDGVDVIVGGPLTKAIVERAPALKLLQVPRAGLDNLGLEWLPPDVPVANTFHHERSIAEYVLLAMLWSTRDPAVYDARLRQGDWAGSCIWGEPPTIEVLDGKTAMLIGSGHIATEIVRRARAFGMRTVIVSRDPAKAAGQADDTIGYGEWQARLCACDFLIPCCPLTPATTGLIGRAELAEMPRTSYVINIARGEIIEETALYEALRDRVIRGAAIDVWYRYPRHEEQSCLPARRPFHELSNVLLTPHVSGWTRQTVEGRMRDVAANIDRLAAGEALKNVVDRR